MQFGFKSNDSTVLCTAIYNETTNPYVNEGSNVLSCLIDKHLTEYILRKKIPDFNREEHDK